MGQSRRTCYVRHGYQSNERTTDKGYPRRIVVVVGPNSTNIDAKLRALGLVPLSDNGGNATVWLPVDKTEEATNKARRASEQQPRTPPNNRILLTIKQAASALGVGR